MGEGVEVRYAEFEFHVRPPHTNDPLIRKWTHEKHRNSLLRSIISYSQLKPRE